MIELRFNNEGYASFYLASGLQVPRGFTPETERTGVEAFHKLLLAHEAELNAMVPAYYAAITQMERLLNRLQKKSRISSTPSGTCRSTSSLEHIT